MGVWWQGGRRGGRSLGRLLGGLLETRYGAAEGVLGAVAVVLIVWLLWPEDSGPKLDQRATWQQSVEEAERRRAALEAKRAESRLEARRALGDLSATIGASRAASSRPAEKERRRIARPSELADRLDRFGRRSGDLALNETFQPSPARPDLVSSGSGQPASETAQAPAGSIEDDRPSLDVAILSSEALDFDPLPEIDLSDLDTLVPSREEPAPAATPDEEIPEEEEIQDAEAVASAPDAAVEPFEIVPNAPSVTDVKERPRDDAPTWLKNAVTSAVVDERPMIAVVIDDLGLNRPKTAALNDLPSPLTLAFLPYAGRIEAQTQAAQAAGHELLLHLPMEPIGSDWPGPDALTTKIDQDEFSARLQKNLNRFRGFVGINNHMGSRLTADGSRMDVVMRELRKRDVLFLDSKTSPRSVAGSFAERNGVPNTTRDVFLDHVINLQVIRRQLSLTERIARQSGSAVAIGHPHGATIQALREWLPSLEARGFTLAPISAVVVRRACSSGVLIAAETCGRYLQARSPDGAAIAAKGG